MRWVVIFEPTEGEAFVIGEFPDDYYAGEAATLFERTIIFDRAEVGTRPEFQRALERWDAGDDREAAMQRVILEASRRRMLLEALEILNNVDGQD